MPTEKRRLAEDPPLEVLTSETRRLEPPPSSLAVDSNTLFATMRPQHHDVCPLRYALTEYGSLCDCCGLALVQDSTQHWWEY